MDDAFLFHCQRGLPTGLRTPLLNAQLDIDTSSAGKTRRPANDWKMRTWAVKAAQEKPTSRSHSSTSCGLLWSGIKVHCPYPDITVGLPRMCAQERFKQIPFHRLGNQKPLTQARIFILDIPTSTQGNVGRQVKHLTRNAS